MTVSAPDDRNLLITLLSASAIQCPPGGWTRCNRKSVELVRGSANGRDPRVAGEGA